MRPPLSAHRSVTTYRGLIVGATWLGSRAVVSPRTWRALDLPGLRRLRLVRYRYLGRQRLTP